MYILRLIVNWGWCPILITALALVGYAYEWPMWILAAVLVIILIIGLMVAITRAGDKVVEKVKQLIHEGNIRRVRIIHEGRTVLEIPLSVGAPAAAVTILVAPLLAALGAFAALVTECTIEVEKIEKS
ncbi:unnamed protein product [marine sediment metagenome]|uniref:DUF4342 domain-containing protein n=1 Tax=marine sediment metagenome TaxID=412755 RepID=X1K0N1_9ZZZZ